MRIPVPNNKLVAFTLVGALLTAVVAGALAAPLGGLAGTGEETADADVSQQLGDDAPSPNEEFTPEVQTQSTYEEHDEEYEDEDEEGEEDEEYEDDGEEYEDEEYEDDGEEYEDEEYEDEEGEEDEEYEDDGEEYEDEEGEEDEEYEG